MPPPDSLRRGAAEVARRIVRAQVLAWSVVTLGP
jgi:hypothetical protein